LIFINQKFSKFKNHNSYSLYYSVMDKLNEEDIDNCMQAFKDLDEDGTDYIKV